MSSFATPISLQPLNDVSQPIVDKNGILLQAFVWWLTTILNSSLLIPQSTASGNVAYPLPPANSMPNRTISFIKTSSDGYTLSVAANGTDLINAQGAWGASSYTVGTAQGAAASFMSDGGSSWYAM